MRIKVGIEAQYLFNRDEAVSTPNRCELIRELIGISSDEFEFIIFVRPATDECISSSEKATIAKIQSVTDAFWEQVALPAAIQKYKPDMLHCTSGTAPLDPGVPLVLTLNDNTEIGFLQSLYRKWVLPRVVSRARSVISVSSREKAGAINYN